jgi:ABC-2 type transport system permease protein
MRTLIALLRKDIEVFCRNRAAVVLTFIAPIGLIYIFGQVFGLNRKESGPNGIPLGVVTAVENSAAKTVLHALLAEKAFRVITTTTTGKGPARPLTENDAREMIRRRELRFAVILPEDLIRETGLGLHLKILSDPRNEIESQTVQGLLQRTILSRVPTLLGQSLQAAAKRALSLERWEGFNQSIATAVAAAFGGDVEQIRRRMASGDFIPGLADAEAPTEKLGSSSGSTAGEVSKPSKDLFSKLINLETLLSILQALVEKSLLC